MKFSEIARLAHRVMDNYPVPQVSEVEHARRTGTLGKIDRSKQYEGRYSPKMLLRGVDTANAGVRKLEKQRFRHAIALLIVSYVLANAPKIWEVIYTYFSR